MKTVLERVKNDILQAGVQIIQEVESPILGEKGGNREYLVMIQES